MRTGGRRRVSRYGHGRLTERPLSDDDMRALYVADQDLTDVYAGQDLETDPADERWARQLSDTDLRWHHDWQRYLVQDDLLQPGQSKSKYRALTDERARRHKTARRVRTHRTGKNAA